MKLQRQQSKEEILEGYLNTIYFGRGAYGIDAAAHAFFDKPAKKLKLRESAVLASVINNPTCSTRPTARPTGPRSWSGSTTSSARWPT